MRRRRKRAPRSWFALTLTAGLLLAGCSLASTGAPILQHLQVKQPTVSAAALPPAVAPPVPEAAPVPTEAPAPIVKPTPAPPPAPALAPASAPTVTSSPGLAPLRTQLQQYLSRQTGTYGIYIVDLTTGESVGINSEKVFPTASTFKLPMSLYIYDQAQKGKINLNEKIAYTKADYEGGTGTLQNWIKPGNALTVRELVDLAIIQSDNIATLMLMRRYGWQNVYAYMKALGGTVTHYAPGVPGTTPREMAIYMARARSTVLMEPLAHTAFHDRTEAGVPTGVTVAHKIGTLPNVINDVALVEAPAHPFIIAAFSQGVDEAVAPGVITEVTRKVYEFLTAG